MPDAEDRGTMPEERTTTILVVDDSPDNRIVIQALLREADPGLRVLAAENGPQALELTARHDPDVILLDLIMPGMDGFEVCTRLKANPATAPIPVIILTALSADPATRVRALDAGAEGFLSKPVEPLDLITHVRAMVKLRRFARSQRHERALLESLVAERTAELEQQLQRSRQIEQKARINEHLLTAFLDTNSDLVFLLDDQMRFLLVNESMAAAVGRPKKDILGQPAIAVMPMEMVSEFRGTAAEILETGSGTTRHHNFDRRHFETSMFRVQLTSGCMAVGGISRDVTDRLQAARELEKAVADWQHTFDASNYGIWILDEHQRVVRSNRVARELFDSPEAGPHPVCWDLFHADHRQHESCPFSRARRTLHREFMEQQIKDRWYRVTVDPMLDAGGRFTGAVHIISDITGRKQAEAERERLESQLLQAQKMESIGQLAGGVAHDFNNMLSIILGNAENAGDLLSTEHPAWPALQEILQTAHRSAELTRQLLAFARKQEIHPRVLEMNQTIKGLLKMISRLIGEQIRVQYLPQDTDLPVYIDPSQFNQILVNLAVNARDAIDGTGTLTIETSMIPQEYARTYLQLPPGDWVQLRVSDNGCGMSPELVARVFEPFFTTKDQGKGTGLGLATVWGIVKQNNGFIKVDSTPRLGTTFTILLPLTGESPEPVPADLPPVATAADSTCTILLVEDEPTILKLSQRILTGLGYRVLSASSPLKALDLAREHISEIRLLVTDVIMPDLNGQELAARLQEMNPALHVLFISGYPADFLKNADGTLSYSYLSKPFSRASLVAKLQEILSPS